jgi:hypothetical protein
MPDLKFELRKAADSIEGLGRALEEAREIFRTIQDSLETGLVPRAENMASIGWQFAELWAESTCGDANEIRKVVAEVSHE